MIAQEGSPVLVRRTMKFANHVFGDGSLGNRDPQLEQLAVDPGSAPQRTGSAHVPNEGDNVWSNGFPPSYSAVALPFPEKAEARPMPADDGIGRHESKSNPPTAPGVAEPCP